MISRVDIVQSFRQLGIDPDAAELLSYSQNYVYRIQSDDGEFVLRLSAGRGRTLEQVCAEIDWLQLLAARELPVCRAVAKLDGEKCRQIDLEKACIVAACFEKPDGQQVASRDADVAMYRELGQLIARMHTVAIDCTKAGKSPGRPTWSKSRLLTTDVDAHSSQLTSEFRESLACLINKVSQVPATPTTFGLIHADVHLGNVHWQGGRPRLFDFDNCEYGYFATDLVTVLYDSIYCRLLNRIDDAELTVEMQPYWQALTDGFAKMTPDFSLDTEQLANLFLIREAVILIHYLRTAPQADCKPGWARGLEKMQRNVELRAHQVNFDLLLS